MSRKQKIFLISMGCISLLAWGFFTWNLLYGLVTGNWILHWFVSIFGILAVSTLFIDIAVAIRSIKRGEN